MGRPRLGRDSSEHHDEEKQGRVRGMAHTYGTACLQSWRSNQPITWGEHVHERTAQKESKGGRQVGFLSRTFRRRRAPERGVMQTQVVSNSFLGAIGIASSAHVLMTRYPAFGKQTDARWAVLLLQQHTRALLHFRGRSWGRHACSEPAAGEKMSVRARQRQVELPAAARLGGAGLRHACLAERSCLLFLPCGHGKRRGFASPRPY
jgi:hypothetical protein